MRTVLRLLVLLVASQSAVAATTLSVTLSPKIAAAGAKWRYIQQGMPNPSAYFKSGERVNVSPGAVRIDALSIENSPCHSPTENGHPLVENVKVNENKTVSITYTGSSCYDK